MVLEINSRGGRWLEHPCPSFPEINPGIYIPYSRKIWQGIKFGGLVVYIITAKISYSQIYVWRSCTEPPNLMFLQ